MAASRVRSYMDKEDAKVLLVTSVMENEGKSTVAANLALSNFRKSSAPFLASFSVRIFNILSTR